MKIVKTADALNALLYANGNSNSSSVGFVPTMGALHQGHLSLVAHAKQNHSIVVCSIFVNPTQFNNSEDLKKYPVTLEKDIDLLEETGCDVLFLPSNTEIYPAGYIPENYNLGYLETILEGKYRPGHFQGVCQVVHRLLDIVLPQSIYLGQKDFQQCMVIKELVQLINSKTQVIVFPTIRENDGLAMSSRNMRLTNTQRDTAPVIFSVLSWIDKSLEPGNLNFLKSQAVLKLESAGFQVDYLEIADHNNLEILDNWDGRKVVILVAAFLGDIRLIDNLVKN